MGTVRGGRCATIHATPAELRVSSVAATLRDPSRMAVLRIRPDRVRSLEQRVRLRLDGLAEVVTGAQHRAVREELLTGGHIQHPDHLLVVVE